MDNNEDYDDAKQRSDSACGDDIFAFFVIGVFSAFSVIENYNDEEWGEFTFSILGSVFCLLFVSLRVYHMAHPETFLYNENGGQ